MAAARAKRARESNSSSRYKVRTWKLVALWLIRLAGPCVLMVAAIGKVFAFSEFRDSLASFTFLPEALRITTGWLVCASEIIPVAMLVGGRWRDANTVTCVLVAAFSAAVCLELVIGGHPHCSCLGVWQKYLQFRSEVPFILLRNAILIFLALSAIQSVSFELPAGREGRS